MSELYRFLDILDNVRCPVCRQDKHQLHIVSIAWQNGLPDGSVACNNCGQSFEFYDGILDLAVNLPPSVVREDEAHKRGSNEALAQGRDDVWLLGLPNSRIETQNDERSKKYARETWTLFCQMKELMSLGAGLDVLEIGAGTTWATRYVAKEGYSCTALDLNCYMYRGLRSASVYFRHDGIYYHRIRGVMENLPLKSETYDRIFSIASLHHSGELSKVFAEIYRVLRLGGRMVIVDSTMGYWLKIFDRQYHAEVRKYGFNDHDYSLSQWRESSRKGGFRRTEVVFPTYLKEKLGRISPCGLSRLEPFLERLLIPYHHVRGTGLVLVADKIPE